MGGGPRGSIVHRASRSGNRSQVVVFIVVFVVVVVVLIVVVFVAFIVVVVVFIVVVVVVLVTVFIVVVFVFIVVVFVVVVVLDASSHLYMRACRIDSVDPYVRVSVCLLASKKNAEIARNHHEMIHMW